MFRTNTHALATAVVGIWFLGTGIVLAQSDMNAPPDSLTIADTGNVGVGTASPKGPLHVEANVSGRAVDLILLENLSGPARLRLNNLSVANSATTDKEWVFNSNGTLRLSGGLDQPEFVLDAAGNLAILGMLTQGSDVNSKQDIRELEGVGVLERLMQLPVAEWSYKTTPAVRHIGPMAQDFHHLFGLGGDKTRVAPLDVAGVALVAIQGLHNMVQEKEARIRAMEQTIAALRAVLEKLNKRLAALETVVAAGGTVTLPVAARPAAASSVVDKTPQSY